MHRPSVDQSERMRVIGEAIAGLVKRRHQLKDLAELGRQSGQRVRLTWVILPKIIVPLGTSVGISRFPLVTVALIFVAVLVFVLQIAADDAKGVFMAFGLVPARIAEGKGLHTLLSHMFLHGGLFHLLGNMLYFWVFARAIEETLGWRKFLLCYLGCGLVAGLVFLLSNLSAEQPAVGASGAISGVLGAFLVFYPTSSIPTYVIQTVLDIPTWLFLGTWIGLQWLYLLIAASLGACTCVAFTAHIGGFFTGVLLARWFKSRSLKEDRKGKSGPV
jgi:membrane associated rhomboid family serine protease